MVLALTAAQVAAPSWEGFHAWPYAAALAVLLVVLARPARTWGRRIDFAGGTEPALPVIGALLIGLAALVSALLGPDARTVRRVPGTVAIVPEAAAAVFFPDVGPAALARGDAGVVLRRRTGAPVLLPSRARVYVDGTLLEIQPRTAAYVQAQTLAGAALTLTQPTNPAFLSPVALFTQTVPIAGRTLPSDAFAVPARHRLLHVFYFATGALPGLRSRGLGSGPIVLFAIDDDAGVPVADGIGAAASGQSISVGGLRVRATVGAYPAVRISSIPSPVALWLGLAGLIGGIASRRAADSSTLRA